MFFKLLNWNDLVKSEIYRYVINAARAAKDSEQRQRVVYLSVGNDH